MSLPLVLCSLEVSHAELLWYCQFILLWHTYTYSAKSFGNSECTLGSKDLQLMFVRHIPSLLLSASDNKLERYVTSYPVVIEFCRYSSCACRCYGGDSFKDPISSTCSLKFPSLNCMLDILLHNIILVSYSRSFCGVVNFIICQIVCRFPSMKCLSYMTVCQRV